MIKRFLAATAKGFEWAAHNPQEAAQILVDQVQQDYSDKPLPEPLDLGLVQQSQQLLSKVSTASILLQASTPATPSTVL